MSLPRTLVWTNLVALLCTTTACGWFEADRPAKPVSMPTSASQSTAPEFVLTREPDPRDVGAEEAPPLTIPAEVRHHPVGTTPVPAASSPEEFSRELAWLFKVLAPRPSTSDRPATEPGVETTQPGLAPATAQSNRAAEHAASSRVIVYGAAWCHACVSLQRRLKDRQVPFAYIDIEDKRALATADGAHITEKPATMGNVVPISRVVQTNGQPTWVRGDGAESVERAYRGS